MAFLKLSKSRRSGKKWLQFIVAALVVGGGLILVYKLIPASSPKQELKPEKPLPKIVEEGETVEGLPPQEKTDQPQSPKETKEEEKAKQITFQTISAKGFSIKVPSEWTLKEKDAPAAAGQTYTTLQSKDYTQVVDQTAEIPQTSVKKGGSLSISRQELDERSFIKDFETMKEFWKLGRGSHFTKSEKEITIAGQRALFHTLSDLKEGNMIDAHVLTPDNKVSFDISLSYNNQDTSIDYEALFNQILNSFNFSS